MRKSFLLFVAAVLAAGSASAQIFERLITSPFVPVPSPAAWPVAQADFDGDGRPDLLLVDGQQLLSYRNVAPGVFELAQSVPGSWPGPNEPIYGPLLVGDFDGDGDADVASLLVLLRNVGGQLQPEPLDFQLSIGTRTVAAADLDGNGDDELLLYQDRVRVFHLGQGSEFVDVTDSTFANAFSTHTVLEADVDGDGDNDLLAQEPWPFLYQGPIFFRLLRNNGAGQFGEEMMVLPGSSFEPFLWMQVADLDGDSVPDLIFNSFANSYLAINDGTGAFQVQQVINDPATFRHLFRSPGDWDQDGDADFVGPYGITMMQGLQEQQTLPMPVTIPQKPLLIDLDGDLDLDLIAGPDFAVVWNSTLGPAPAHRVTVVGGEPLGPFASTAPYFRDQPGNGFGAASIAANHLAGWGTNGSSTSQPLVAGNLAGTFTDVAFMSSSSGFSMCACTSEGPRGYSLGTTLTDFGLMTPSTLGAPTHVGAGDLDASDADELVFGGSSLSGPRILREVSWNGWADVSPALPPAAIPQNPPPVFETVLVADIDGDGDQDLVHELRVLRNDGNDQWSVGASLAGLVPATAARFAALDFDGDGDRDLLVFGANCPTLLLRNDGASFYDATIGHLPSAAWTATALASIGDIDGDGGDDILTTDSASSHLLRNDDGVFVRHANVGPRGILVDANDDGRADLFTGTDVLPNRHTHLHERHVPAPGMPWTLEVHAWRQGPVPQLGLVAIGSRRMFSPVTLPGIGKLGIDLTYADLFPVALSGGRGEVTLPIPFTPAIVGADVYAQALVIGTNDLTLTGLVADRVH